MDNVLKFGRQVNDQFINWSPEFIKELREAVENNQ